MRPGTGILLPRREQTGGAALSPQDAAAVERLRAGCASDDVAAEAALEASLRELPDNLAVAFREIARTVPTVELFVAARAVKLYLARRSRELGTTLRLAADGSVIGPKGERHLVARNVAREMIRMRANLDEATAIKVARWLGAGAFVYIKNALQ